jgi:hypothetical protein
VAVFTDHIAPAFDKVVTAGGLFFKMLDMGFTPLEAFKDLLWVLLPPDMAGKVNDFIGEIERVIATVKEWAADPALFREFAAGMLGLVDTDKAAWTDIGLAIGGHIVDGIRSLATSAAQALLGWSEDLLEWVNSKTYKDAIHPIGRKIGQEIGTALTDYFTSEPMQRDMRDSISHMLAQTLLNLASVLARAGWLMGLEIGLGIRSAITGKEYGPNAAQDVEDWLRDLVEPGFTRQGQGAPSSAIYDVPLPPGYTAAYDVPLPPGGLYDVPLPPGYTMPDDTPLPPENPLEDLEVDVLLSSRNFEDLNEVLPEVTRSLRSLMREVEQWRRGMPAGNGLPSNVPTDTGPSIGVLPRLRNAGVPY